MTYGVSGDCSEDSATCVESREICKNSWDLRIWTTTLEDEAQKYIVENRLGTETLETFFFLRINTRNLLK
jgi:hypothetical protein